MQLESCKLQLVPLHICHQNEWGANIRPNKPQHLQVLACMFCHICKPFTYILSKMEKQILKHEKTHPSIRTYNVLPHITTSSHALDISSNADPCSLFFVLYQIYSPTPSSPPKYVFLGTKLSSSQQSGMSSSSPTGSAVARSNKLHWSSLNKNQIVFSKMK